MENIQESSVSFCIDILYLTLVEFSVALGEVGWEGLIAWGWAGHQSAGGKKLLCASLVFWGVCCSLPLSFSSLLLLLSLVAGVMVVTHFCFNY